MQTKIYIQKHLNNEIKKKGKALIFASGGKSVKKIFFQLSKTNIDWGKVEIFFIDERQLKKNNLNSNYYLISSYLFKNLSRNLKINFLDNKYLLKKKLNKFILYIQKYKPITIMGMGDDGHIASIFQKSLKYKNLINLNLKPSYVLTEKIGKPKVKRITMNIKMIGLSSKIILVLNNKNKQRLFYKYTKNKDFETPVYSLVTKLKRKTLLSFGSKIL